MPPVRYPITLASATFVLLHLAALAVCFVPCRPALVGMALALYALRMFGVTAGYHRYFSHRAFRLARPAQCLLAILAQSAGQKGVLWWAAHHRDHHRHSDQAGDIHSPVTGSFFWSHVGWVLSDRYECTDLDKVKDLARFPELRWLERFHWLPSLALALLVAVWGASSGVGLGASLAWFALSTVAVYHATFTINSLAHVWGTRRFETQDRSRNNALLALLTFGEGWHNNHHRHPGSCRQGLRWWELDLTQGALRILAWVNIVTDIKSHSSGVQS